MTHAWDSVSCYFFHILFIRMESVSPYSRGEGLDSAFGRKKHQRACEHNFKIPHYIPVVLTFIIYITNL